MPQKGDELTKEQVKQIENLVDYTRNPDDVVIEKNWHQGPDGGGLFEVWALKNGYPGGFPIYAGVKIQNRKYHVYWLPNTNKMRIAGLGENPVNN
ncbi:hypothetical protein A6S26_22035 [Nostoc sp. ATCC 43529]|nr:hypothetical protein A6S26_22035 [Nostoc sp. ATCC 43529]